MAGLYTDQKFVKELSKLKHLYRILLVEFKYTREEADKIEEELKKLFPYAVVMVILQK